MAGCGSVRPGKRAMGSGGLKTSTVTRRLKGAYRAITRHEARSYRRRLKRRKEGVA